MHVAKKKCMLTYVTNSDLKTDCVNMLVNMCSSESDHHALMYVWPRAGALAPRCV